MSKQKSFGRYIERGKSVKIFTRVGSFVVVLAILLSLGSFAAFAEDGHSEIQEVIDDRTEEEIVVSGEVSFDEKMIYLPDVTAEMSNPSFWIRKVKHPNQVLADQTMIDVVNQAILEGEECNMKDLRNWPETYDGIAANASLIRSATDDADYFYRNGVRYDDNGVRYPSKEAAMEELYAPLIANVEDPNATSEMPVQYAICTNRTCLLAYPTDHPLYDDPSDPDFNYLYLSVVRVNEPLILQTRSKDGKYYQAIASSLSGWISAEDVAICQNKEKWLSAWDIPAEKTLVVYDDKIYTEDSNYAPETANKLLPMGTCLELADEEDWTPLIINRRPYNNYVVWLPIRQEDGTYKKELALIGENRKVSVGFLPVTSANIISVAMNQLGDTYGWGGMLGSEDCSGYARDVYKCFGIEMARNTTWQAAQPVYKPDISGLSLEEKAELIKSLPPGALMIFRGHAMLYLGEDQGKLYVISSISDVVIDGKVRRVRGGMINTLDMLRGNGNTWLQEIYAIEIPYYTKDHERKPEPEWKSGWNQEDGNWYFCSNAGDIQYGWVNDGNAWYYTDPETGIMQTGWVQVNGVWYWMNSSGAMATGWQNINGVWYYLSASGAMVTGWQKINGLWYYLKESGAMATGWQEIGGTWYFLKESGAMAAGEWWDGYWLNANGSWTYQPRGSWKKDDQGWWFGDTSGWYAKNTTCKINDISYRFNGQGYWIEN